MFVTIIRTRLHIAFIWFEHFCACAYGVNEFWNAERILKLLSLGLLVSAILLCLLVMLDKHLNRAKLERDSHA